MTDPKNHCPSCGGALPGDPRRPCRLPEGHAWWTPAERRQLPPHIRAAVEHRLRTRGLPVL